MSEKAGVKVGDIVQFIYGRGKVTGTVKEDRGPIGVKGRRLYLVEFSPDPDSPSQIELPEAQLELSPAWVVLGLGRRGPSVETSSNVSSVADHGGNAESFDLDIIFGKPMPDDLYACQVTANRSVNYRIVEKTKDWVHLVLEAPLPERVKITCSA